MPKLSLVFLFVLFSILTLLFPKHAQAELPDCESTIITPTSPTADQDFGVIFKDKSIVQQGTYQIALVNIGDDSSDKSKYNYNHNQQILTYTSESVTFPKIKISTAGTYQLVLVFVTGTALPKCKAPSTLTVQAPLPTGCDAKIPFSATVKSDTPNSIEATILWESLNPDVYNLNYAGYSGQTITVAVNDKDNNPIKISGTAEDIPPRKLDSSGKPVNSPFILGLFTGQKDAYDINVFLTLNNSCRISDTVNLRISSTTGSRKNKGDSCDTSLQKSTNPSDLCPDEAPCLPINTTSDTTNGICGGPKAIQPPKPATEPPPGGAGQPCTDAPASADHPGIQTAIGCVPTEPTEFIKAVSQLATGAGGGIALLLMIAGVFRMITSAGNPDAVKAGSEQFTSALIGLLFIIFAVLLLKVIGVDILKIPGFS